MATQMVIRIRQGGGDDMDWTVLAEEVTFTDTLTVISNVIPGVPAPAAFEYEDEDGDRITVRSEIEMAAMLSYYADTYIRNIPPPPLIIYPRTSKPSEKRNIFSLKVQTKSQQQNSIETAAEIPMDQGSSKQQPGDICDILACGHIKDTDLHYLEILGSGNCGTVYKANYRPGNKIMAVKVIPLDITSEVQKEIMSELEILYKTKSTSIIDFYGAFFVDNRISICTEFMDGGALDKYGQIPEKVLGRMAVSVVKGLHYLWRLKILHRDVKPSNILVNTKGHVKLCDFGVSVQLVSSIAKTYVGTNAYMAPERIQGEDYGIQSEVWSLGILLFEMAIGRFPYDSALSVLNKPMELLNCIVLESPPQLPRGIYSDPFVEFVALCMKKVPRSRPAPEALLKHPFLLLNDDGNTEIIAYWVQVKLEEIARRQLAHKTSSA